MIAPYKNRQIDFNKPVFVYKNLHKNCWSIKQNNHIVGHSTKITLNNCVFVVSEAGRQRVIKNKQKNVHAGVIGVIGSDNVELTKQIFYNPYKNCKFVDENNNVVISSEKALLIGGKVFI